VQFRRVMSTAAGASARLARSEPQPLLVKTTEDWSRS